MTDHPNDAGTAPAAGGCPMHRTLPGDSTPLRPSPEFARWRTEGRATPLGYGDGHQGLIVTEYDLARAVLEDPRFTIRSGRMPAQPQVVPHLVPAGHTTPPPAPLDDQAQESERSGLLSLDGAEHARLRRAVAATFALKKVRARRSDVAATVATMLDRFIAEGSPNDLWTRFAQPIAARTHCQVLGVPAEWEEEWIALFATPGATQQQRYDLIRRLADLRTLEPGDDSISQLIANPEVSRIELEGLMLMLMMSGRDSVAYTITTALVALLTHPDQLAALRADPALIGPAVEEFMRVSAMFLTVFPRTALEDVEVDGCPIPAGTTVSVSPVAANRDPGRWADPDSFDVSRDAFGHLGFSHGIHACIGQQLARIEITEAVTQLLARLPDLALVSAEQLEPMPFAHPVATYEAGEALATWNHVEQ